MNAWVAIVTLLSLLFYAYTGVQVGRGRGRHGVDAPAMTGPPEFERLVRVQANTLEWLVIYLPSLWLFAAYVSATVGALLGVVWIVGRVLYARGYARAAAQRSTGFMIQLAAIAVLLFGALGGAAWSLVGHSG